MAKFLPGQSGNPLGRPRFTAVDEIKRELKKRKAGLVQEIFENLDKLEEPREKLVYLFKLMEFLYSKPKDDIPFDHAVQLVKAAAGEPTEDIEETRASEYHPF